MRYECVHVYVFVRVPVLCKFMDAYMCERVRVRILPAVRRAGPAAPPGCGSCSGSS